MLDSWFVVDMTIFGLLWNINSKVLFTHFMGLKHLKGVKEQQYSAGSVDCSISIASNEFKKYGHFLVISHFSRSLYEFFQERFHCDKEYTA